MLLILPIIFLAGASGLYIGIVGFRDYRNITITAEKVTVMQIIKISSYFGVASTLVFFAAIMCGGLFDKEYTWSLQRFGSAVLVSLFLGLINTLGGMYQVYTTVIFRDLLVKKYKGKAKKES